MAGAAVSKKAQEKYLPRIERALRSEGGGFLVGGVLSMADVQLFYVLDYVAVGDVTPNPFWADGDSIYEGDEHFMDSFPLVKQHYEMMQKLPQVEAYLSGPLRLPRNGPEGWVDRVKTTLPHLFSGENYPMSSEVWNYDC